MTESSSVHSVEKTISQSQISLTQDQRDRIAKQRQLALARRSAKTEVLLNSSPSYLSQKDGDQQTMSSSCRATDILNKVRSSPSLPSKSFLTASSPNPFHKFARKPFSPPVRIIDLEDDSHGNEADFNNAKETCNSDGSASFRGEKTHTHGAMPSFDVDQEGNYELNSMARSDAGQRGNHDVNSMAGHGNTQKRQWLWLPADAKATPKGSINVASFQGQHVRARREPRHGRRARSGAADCLSKNNDNDEWRSVRKRSLAGHIFGQINSETLSNRIPNAVMDATSQINSKLLSTRKTQVKLTLSSQQRNVLMAIAAGKSVFLTGSAGTGKSYLLHEAVYTLKNMYGLNSVFVTASTGLAACAIGGTTLHSFAGIGLGMGEKRELANKVSTKREARKRWMDCKALIIDEISMIDGELFDKLEYVARAVRGPAYKDKVFGGIQLVVTGDFFQLPPVQPESPEKYFAFQADCWNDCFELQVELTQVFRQSDSEFVKMLIQ